MKYVLITFLHILIYSDFRNYFEDKAMAFFWWVVCMLILFGAAFAVEWVIDFWYSWPFEE